MTQQRREEPKPFALVNVRIHRTAWDGITHMAEVLAARASKGIPVAVRIELGRTHLVDALVALGMKEWKIDAG